MCVSEELREKFQSLHVDVKHTEERTKSRLREFQRDNQGLREELASLQAQLHQQEHWHDHELAIALRGININTRKIIAVAQKLENHLNHPQ